MKLVVLLLCLPFLGYCQIEPDQEFGSDNGMLEPPLPPVEKDSLLPSVEQDSPLPPVDEDFPIPPVEKDFPIPPVEQESPIPPVEKDSPIPLVEQDSPLPPVDEDFQQDSTLPPVDEDFQQDSPLLPVDEDFPISPVEEDSPLSSVENSPLVEQDFIEQENSEDLAGNMDDMITDREGKTETEDDDEDADLSEFETFVDEDDDDDDTYLEPAEPAEPAEPEKEGVIVDGDILLSKTEAAIYKKSGWDGLAKTQAWIIKSRWGRKIRYKIDKSLRGRSNLILRRNIRTSMRAIQSQTCIRFTRRRWGRRRGWWRRRRIGRRRGRWGRRRIGRRRGRWGRRRIGRRRGRWGRRRIGRRRGRWGRRRIGRRRGRWGRRRIGRRRGRWGRRRIGRRRGRWGRRRLVRRQWGRRRLSRLWRYMLFKKHDTNCFVSGLGGPLFGAKEIFLSKDCSGYGRPMTPAHEIMHAMGRYHEQSRPDRDRFIRVNWNNLIAKSDTLDCPYQFRKAKIARTYGIPYDYYSVMHYSPGQCAKSSTQPSMTILNPGIDKSRMGQLRVLTSRDIQHINKRYCRSMMMRLVGGKGRNEGRVEVYNQNVWGSVCSNSFDKKDGNVICKYLGHPGLEEIYNKEETPSSMVRTSEGAIWMNNLQCNGNEETPFDCLQSTFGEHDCTHNQDVALKCSKAARLVDGNGDSGRLEVYHDGEWGSVCSHKFGYHETTVACRMMGYSYAKQAYTKSNAYFDAVDNDSNDEIVLSELKCSGTESHLSDCDFDDEETCSQGSPVHIECSNEMSTEDEEESSIQTEED